MGKFISTVIIRGAWLAALPLIGVLITPHIVNSQNIQRIHVSPDQEKRSCIQNVDGYAFLSENMTLAETRTAAFGNAKRQAVERSRTYIKSKTKVEDFVLKSDKITATSEGAVTILEQKDHGIENNTRYHVWIKAEVEYTLNPGKHVDIDNKIEQDALLTVNVWTPKKKYKKDEDIEIFILGNRDFYAKIVDITSTGKIIQLLPNDYSKTNFFKGETVYKIPGPDDRFDLTVKAPYGQDQIVVYASEVPLGNIDMEQAGNGLYQYRGSRTEFASKTRGIAVVGSDQGTASEAEFYEAIWTLTTSK